MFISDFAIRKPIITVVTMLALVVFGLAALAAAEDRRVPRRAAADRRGVGAVPGRRARERRAGSHRARRRRHLGDQRRVADPVVGARQLRGVHRPVRVREGPPGGHPANPRRDQRHPQRPAAGDGRAGAHAVRPGRPARGLARAVVDDAHGPGAHAARRPGHRPAAPRAAGRGPGDGRRRHRARADGRTAARRRCRRRAWAWRRWSARCRRRTSRRRSAGCSGTSTSGRFACAAGSRRRPTSSGWWCRSRRAGSCASATWRSCATARRSRDRPPCSTAPRPSASKSSSRRATARRPSPRRSATRRPGCRPRCRPARRSASCVTRACAWRSRWATSSTRSSRARC